MKFLQNMLSSSSDTANTELSSYYNFKYFLDCLKSYQGSEISQVMSEHETMRDQWYESVGRSAVHNIILACLNSHLKTVSNVLDMPCGHGRVLRHLVKLFPDASFTACDLDKAGVDFCGKEFNAKKIYSNEDLLTVDFNEKYDVIWVGSLFTHTSRDLTRKWIAYLCEQLSPQGILVITLHGRWSISVNQQHPYIEAKKWQKILDEYNQDGYGYADYSDDESHDYIEGSYGISLSRASTVIEDIEKIPDVRILLYRERSWADHQDLLVIGKPAYDKEWGV